MPRPLLLAAGAAAAAAAAAVPASAATVVTDRPCYVEGEPMTISGAGFAPNAAWSVQADQVFASGTTDATGAFVDQTQTAPIVVKRTTKPQPFTLTGMQAGAPVAQAGFHVVNLLVALASTRGKPTSRTTWRFSGFLPGRRIYVHVRRGGRTMSNARAGTGDPACGRLTRRLRRLPGMSVHRIHSGTYDLYVDNSPHFDRRQRPQYRASLTVFRTPARR